jgi:hypothetical protein
MNRYQKAILTWNQLAIEAGINLNIKIPEAQIAPKQNPKQIIKNRRASTIKKIPFHQKTLGRNNFAFAQRRARNHR